MKEIGKVETQAAKTQAAIDRYFEAFEPVGLLHRLRQRWLAIKIEDATRDLRAWAAQSDLCQRVATVPELMISDLGGKAVAVVAGRRARYPPTASHPLNLTVSMIPPLDGVAP